ncbi:hypothetical protein SAMN04488009_2038 [Maribacter sedimenticola]|uniref:Transposase n=1 Tax=Maribacter sedimenticola TaxID=228956 RepID=A0ABY1SHH1_9FLAO|nr:hypothetical protein [Maribacter sedimenticola]SNR47555.1 hypothetical protein SAMN04488009_2038 [Maribacter sedimenticola]
MAKSSKRSRYGQVKIVAKHVFCANNQVFVREHSSQTNLQNAEWSPVSFEWEKVGKFQENLVL